MEILEKVKSLLPSEVISRIELEGSEIIVYTKDREFFTQHESIVREVVDQIKKRIEVRPEKNLTIDEEATKEKIKQIVPEEAKIKEIYFEPERSLVIIAAEKPGLVIGRGGETFRQIRSETLWVPRIERVPAIKSDIVESIRKVIHNEVKFRKEFLNKIGENIFGERKTIRDWIRIVGFGGWREVGRSCLQVETPKSKVLIDCGIKAGATNAEAYPIFNTKEFDYNELDAVIVSHSHLDHCLSPDNYIQLPNGEITTIENYHNSAYNRISAVDIDGTLKIDDLPCAEKVKLKAPENMYEIKTKLKKIKVTDTHPFFVFDQSKIKVKKTSELKVGEFLATVKKIELKGVSQDLPPIVRNLRVLDTGRKILRKVRIEKNLKQSEVAEQIGCKQATIGCKQATISALETDKDHLWKPEFIKKISRFYGLNGFLENHTECVYNKSTKIKLPEKTSEGFCQFLGYLLGDGNKVDFIKGGKRYVRIDLTDKDKKNLEIYQNLAKAIFDLRGRIRVDERTRLHFYSPILLDLINKIDENILCKSPYRKIPSIIHKVSEKELAAFIRGLFDAEGSVGGHQIKTTSSSCDIVQVMQMLLLRFGIISHIYEQEGFKRKAYQLTISHPESVIKFTKSINFGSTAKRKKLKKLVRSSAFGVSFAERIDLVPISNKFILNIAGRLGLRKADLKELKINYYHYHDHSPSRNKVKEIIKTFKKISDKKKLKIPELEFLERIIKSNILWEPIVDIKVVPSNCSYVYDLKVPAHHNYIVNGIVVHNCGFVPTLYEYGFGGPLYCTTPTLDLATLLWFDFIDVMQRNAVTPLFTAKGVKEAVKHTIPLEYGEVSDVAPDVRLTFQPSGHILGSGLIHLHIGEGLHNIVYAVDQKFARTTLLDPAFTDFSRVETLIIESTYGSSEDIFPPRVEVEKQFMEIVNRTMERKGIVLVPSFSVERAQELMAILVENNFQYPVYLDGMIWDANGIFTAYPEYLSRNMQKKIFQGQDPFLNPIFKRIASSSEREKSWEDKPCIIISTSGMLIGGPVFEHLKTLAEDSNNTLIFTGYQVEGTLGRRIQKGWKEIPVVEDGKTIAIELKMEVQTADGLSGHSDRNQLLGFVGRLASRPDKVVVVHGEPTKTVDLAKTINRIFRIETVAPKNLESIRLK